MFHISGYRYTLVEQLKTINMETNPTVSHKYETADDYRKAETLKEEQRRMKLAYELLNIMERLYKGETTLDIPTHPSVTIKMEYVEREVEDEFVDEGHIPTKERFLKWTVPTDRYIDAEAIIKSKGFGVSFFGVYMFIIVAL